MATKTAKKRSRRSLAVKVDTRPLFKHSEEVSALASAVLATRETKSEEERVLSAFVTKMDKVQAAIREACDALAGNPMFRKFTIRSR